MIVAWAAAALGAPLPFAQDCATNWLVPDTDAHAVREQLVPLHRLRERILLQQPTLATEEVALDHACFLWKDLRARTLVARYVAARADTTDYYRDLYADMVGVCVPECRRIATQLDLAYAATLADETWCVALCGEATMTTDVVCGSAQPQLAPAAIEACRP